MIDAGDFHVCGAELEGGTIGCWGNNDAGQSDAPEGEFTNVAAGSYHSCGVRSDGTVECWGCAHPEYPDFDNGQCEVPQPPAQ